MLFIVVFIIMFVIGTVGVVSCITRCVVRCIVVVVAGCVIRVVVEGVSCGGNYVLKAYRCRAARGTCIKIMGARFVAVIIVRVVGMMIENCGWDG